MRSLVAAVVLLAPGVAFAQTGDVGVTFIPALFQHLDEPPVCCAASGWITLGSGPRFRMQVDYVQSRRRSEGYGPSVRIPAPPEYGPDHILLHARLTDEDHRRCADNGYGRGWIFPQVGVAVDWPLGDAFFIRADARLMLPRVGVGAGFRF